MKDEKKRREDKKSCLGLQVNTMITVGTCQFSGSAGELRDEHCTAALTPTPTPTPDSKR
jgi:hypothetical protein